MKHYFSRFEWGLFLGSITFITVSFFAFGGEGYLTLAASLIGAASLIFSAKGNPIGPALMVIFSIIYAVVSYSFAYYGEMITYLGMTMPMSVWALGAWLKNPYKNRKSEVAVASLGRREVIFMFLLSAMVTLAFYFILKKLGNASLLPATVSVTTSFLGACLTLRRSPYFALAYAANDVVLLCLWIIASLADTAYISVVICFSVFLINDLYGFISWKQMKKRQHCQ